MSLNMDYSKEFCFKIIDEYYNLKNWDWSDYHNATKYMFEIVNAIGFYELEKNNYIEKYFYCLSKGLGFAGEDDEVGYDFQGISTIKENAKCLNYESLNRILKHFENIKYGRFDNSLRSKVIDAIINFANLDDREKRTMKFRYFDMYYLSRYSLRAFNSIIKKMYSDYEFMSVKENNDLLPKGNPKVDERIFWSVLIKGNNKLYEKVEITESNFFISLTPNPDINNIDDYITDINIIYNFKDEVSIEINKLNGEKVDKNLSLPFCFDIWNIEEIENMEFREKITTFLKKYFYEDHFEFELIYFYANSIYNKYEREVKFSNIFDVEIGEKIKVTENNERIEMPHNFYGEYINNVLAIIGKNGSGKTTVFRMILENPLFSGVLKDEYERKWGKYFLIYRLNNKYYYACSDSFTIDENSIYLIRLENKIPINLCLISNTFDVFTVDNEKNDYNVQSTGVLSGFIDLSTNTILRTYCKIFRDASVHGIKHENTIQTDPIQEFRLQEMERINNLYNYLNEDQRKDLNLEKQNETYEFSSGQYARWSLFGRILSIFYRENSSKSSLPEIRPCENYFLFLDEAELYMHPEWQRNLIFDIIEFLKIINSNGRYFSNITIIISSNSPFLMTDLPDNSIQLFEPDNSEKIKTFGQNIYTLLKSKFFMPNGTIGKFAMGKIKEAFEEANNFVSEKQGTLETAQYINSIIGEEVYHYYLEELLNKTEDVQ